MKKSWILLTACAALLSGVEAIACTGLLVGKKASTDGSVMISYAADSHSLYGEMYRWPAATWPKGAMLEVKEWDTGKPLGKIAQVEKTYSVVGNMNEHQVAITESTFGGRHELVENGLPADEYFNNLDIEGKALVLYTGNMATNDYATKDFFMFDMKLNWDSLAALLYNHPKFILIDSHGLGMFSQHRLFDMECEKNGCFLIMCLMLEGEEILNIKKLKIEIDKEMPSTGKPCRVYGF